MWVGLIEKDYLMKPQYSLEKKQFPMRLSCMAKKSEEGEYCLIRPSCKIKV